jgi:hypothetical protein
MTRSRRQIDDDARTAADAVRAAERPMTAEAIADTLRRIGRPQTEKQAWVTAGRAEDLGLLRKRGRGAWDVPGLGTTLASGAVSVPPAELFVECAKRLLEMPHSPATATAARTLLEAATRQQHSHSAPVPKEATNAQPTNGAAPHDRREIEVLQPPVTE